MIRDARDAKSCSATTFGSREPSCLHPLSGRLPCTCHTLQVLHRGNTENGCDAWVKKLSGKHGGMTGKMGTKGQNRTSAPLVLRDLRDLRAKFRETARRRQRLTAAVVCATPPAAQTTGGAAILFVARTSGIAFFHSVHPPEAFSTAITLP